MDSVDLAVVDEVAAVWVDLEEEVVASILCSAETFYTKNNSSRKHE